MGKIVYGVNATFLSLMKIALTIIVSLLCTLTPYCQTALTKTEILTERTTHRIVPKLDSIYYEGYHFKARKYLDELLIEKIDTLIVYNFDYPGHIFFSKNDSCGEPRNAYFFWKKGGEYFFRTNNRSCFSLDKISASKIINFGVENISKIKDEFFMGAIFKAERNGDRISMTESSVDHEGKHAILVLINGQYNYLAFTDNGITNKKSLFLDYNKALKSFKLFELIRAELKTRE